MAFAYTAIEDAPITVPPAYPPPTPVPPPPVIPPDPPDAPPVYTSVYVGRTYRTSSYTINVSTSTAVGVIVGTDANDSQISEPSTSHSLSINGGWSGIWLYALNNNPIATQSLTISGSYLESFGSLDDIAGLTTVDFSQNTPLVFGVIDSTDIETLDLSDNPSLQEVSATGAYELTSIDLTNCTQLTELILDNNPELATVTLTGSGVTTVDLSNSAITTFSYPNDNFIDVTLDDCDSLTTVTMSNNTALTDLIVSNSSTLSTLNFSGCTSINVYDFSGSTKILSFDASGCGLSQSECDDILKDLDTFNTDNGYVDVSSNSVLGAQGLTAKSSLEGRGWTVLADVARVFTITPAEFAPVRGVAFNVTLQALTTNNEPDTTYVPSGDTDLIITGDPSDVISPTSTDNTGWVDGEKTVSVTINGGTGADSTIFTAQQAADGVAGTITLVVGGVETGLSLAGFSDDVVGGGNEATLSAALLACNANTLTTTASTSPFDPKAAWYSNTALTDPWVANAWTYWQAFTIPAALLGTVTKAYLKVRLQSGLYTARSPMGEVSISARVGGTRYAAAPSTSTGQDIVDLAATSSSINIKGTYESDSYYIYIDITDDLLSGTGEVFVLRSWLVINSGAGVDNGSAGVDFQFAGVLVVS